VKCPRWGRGMLLLLLSSCVFLGKMAGQKDEDLAPPQKMRFCLDKDCENLTWVGDHYEGRKDGQTAIVARFWLKQWEADHVEFEGKTAMAIAGGYPLEATFTGKIAPGGGSIVGGVDEWRIGYSASGTLSYTLTWDKSASNAMAVGNVGQFQAPRHSKTHPNILLPPGASEDYASYPDDVRAILQPEHPLTPKDSKRACNDPYVIDENVALEIGKFAYRAGEIPRGNCWTRKAAMLNSTRGRILLALGWHTGWQGPKDDAKFFGMLKMYEHERDPFGMYYLEQCYVNGIGTAKDTHEATQVDMWLMTSQAGQDVQMMIGADDEEVMREYRRLQVLMNPPMKSVTRPPTK